MTYLVRFVRVALLAALVCGLAGTALAQEKAENRQLKPVSIWKESVGDEELVKKPLRPAYIKDVKTLEALYKDLKLGGKVPEVNFKTEILLYVITSYSNCTIDMNLTDKGDLITLGVGNRDFVPGLRCVFTTVKKDGVKTINGQPFKE